MKNLFLSERSFGEVAEWSIAAVLKTVVPRGTRGSNPCLSAGKRCKSSICEIYTLFYASKTLKWKCNLIIFMRAGTDEEPAN